MNDLRAHFYSTLKANSTLTGLLGGVGQIRHRELPSEPYLTAAAPGILVFSLIGLGPRSGGRANAEQDSGQLSIDIYARRTWLAWQIVYQIESTIGNTTATKATYRFLTLNRASLNDLGIDPGLKCPHINVTYDIGGIFKNSG